MSGKIFQQGYLNSNLKFQQAGRQLDLPRGVGGRESRAANRRSDRKGSRGSREYFPVATHTLSVYEMAE